MKRSALTLLTAALCAAPVCAQDAGVGTYELEGSIKLNEGGERPATVELKIEKTDTGYTATRTMNYTGPRDRRAGSVSWVSTEVTVNSRSMDTWRSAPRENATIKVVWRVPTEVPEERTPAGTAVSPERGAIGALENEPSFETYTVVSGDNLTRIAQRNGTTVAALMELNGLTSDTIRIDQVLKVRELEPEPVAAPEPEIVMVPAENVFNTTLELDSGVTATETLVNTTQLTPEDTWTNGRFKGLLRADGDRRLRLGHPLGVSTAKTLTLVVPTDGKLTVTTSSGSLILKDRFGAEVARTTDTTTVTHEVEANAIGTYSVTVEEPSLATVKATLVQAGATDSRIKDWGGSIWGLAEWGTYDEYTSGKKPSDKRLYSAGGPLDRFDSAFGLTERRYDHPKMSAVFWERGGDDARPYPKSMMANGHYCRFSSLDESMAEIAWHFDFNGDGHETSRYHELQVIDGRIVPMDPAGAVGAKIRKRTNTERAENDGDGTLFSENASDWRIYRVNNENSTRQVFYANHNPGSNTISFYKSAADRAHGIAAIDSEGMSGIAAIATITNPRPFMSFDVRGPNRLRIKGKLGAMLEPGQMAQVYGGDWTDQYDWDGNKSREDIIRRGWYGHCNAKSIASSFFRAPKEGTFNGIVFRESDLKGILSEYAMGTVQRTGFHWGEKGVGRDKADYARDFHELLYKWLRVEKNSVWGDHTLRTTGQNGGSVWNYVISSYSAEFVEAEGDDPYVLDVKTKTGSTSRTSHYRLQFNRFGRILSDPTSKTEWTSDKWWRYVYHTTDITYAHRNRNRAVTHERLNALFEGLGGLKFQDIDEIEAEEAAAAAAAAAAEEEAAEDAPEATEIDEGAEVEAAAEEVASELVETLAGRSTPE